MSRLLVLLVMLALMEGQAGADSDGVHSAVVVVFDTAAPFSDAHTMTRRGFVDAIAEGDPEDHLGVVTVGSSATVVVKLQALANTKAFSVVEKIRHAKGTATVAGLNRAFAMLKASKVERRRVVLVSHAKKLPAAAVKLGAKFREAGIEVAALGFQDDSFDTLATFAPAEETSIALDSPAFARFFRVAMGWIRCAGC